MEKQSSNKKSNVFQIILYTVVVALIVTVILQNHHINTLKKEGTEITMAEYAADKKDLPTVGNKEHQDKINKPEFKINNRNSGQTYVEDNLPKVGAEENQKKAEEEVTPEQQFKPEENISQRISSEMQKNPAMENMIRNQAKTNLTSSYNDFAEENNLSPETKNSLVDLLVEKELEIMDIATQDGGLLSGKINPEELEQELEYVNRTYDEKISELISPEKLTAYKEYEKTIPERDLLKEFKSIDYIGGIQLDRQQEKEMVAAMYNERQKFTEIQKENPQSMNTQDLFSKENLKKNLARKTKQLKGYLESTRGVLSESQQDNFGEFIDSRISMLEMSAQFLGASRKEETDK